jgi:methionine biosynthesis protein MetW
MNRLDFDLLKHWITPNSRVLDLGCGDGSLLENLIQEKQVDGLGLEINADKITQCIAKGLNVLEQNLDDGLSNIGDNSFDTVVMTQTLQAMHFPHLVLDEMLRVGKQCIITFPNFGHWRCRAHLLSKGRMPVSEFMPYSWYDTPNIHFCTVNDFEALCQQKQIKIVNRAVVNQNNLSTWAARSWPNLFAVTAIYHVTK